MRSPGKTTVIVVMLITAVTVRGLALWLHHAHLEDDRDAYLAVAESVAQGRGFLDSKTSEPTAYRPPLYPLVLAGLLKLGGGSVLLAALHLTLSVGTVLLTLLLARRLQLGGTAYVAAFLVALDPLLAEYATFPMTETLFTFLVTLMLLLIARPASPDLGGGDSSNDPLIAPRNYRRPFALGATFGLCALCRPTIWAFGGLVVLIWMWRFIKSSEHSTRTAATLGSVVLTAAVVVSPWMVRNLIVFGRPMLTTTHGGYTLLLANNPVFYSEVVDKPWGTVWDDAPDTRTQQAWYGNVEAAMAGELNADAGEIERDRWMYDRAWQNIRNEPALFLRACVLRFRRFWNIAPQGKAGTGLAPPILWGVRLFYGLVLVAMVVGLLRLLCCRPRSSAWWPLVLLIVSFCGVHLFYWTNLRMRAPLIPAIALLAASALSRRRGGSDEAETR